MFTRLGASISYRRLLGMTDELAELDYHLLKTVPSLLGLSDRDFEVLLDIETERFSASISGSPFEVVLRSLGHSQHASPDYASGCRFGIRTCAIFFYDVGAKESVWFESVSLGLSLFERGFDVLWLDVEGCSDEADQWSSAVFNILNDFLRELRVRKAVGFGVGTGGGLLLKILASEGSSFFDNLPQIILLPELNSGFNSLESGLSVSIKSRNFQVLAGGGGDPRILNMLENLEAFFRVELKKANTCKEQTEQTSKNPKEYITTLPPLKGSDMRRVAIPGESLNRGVFHFSKSFLLKLSGFLTRSSISL